MLKIEFLPFDKRVTKGDGYIMTPHYAPCHWWVNKIDEFFRDEFVKEMVKDIDGLEHIGRGAFEGSGYNNDTVTYHMLSDRVRALAFMFNEKKPVSISAAVCDDRCAKWILEIAKRKDLSINTSHYINFDTDFEAYIVNSGRFIKTREEYREEWEKAGIFHFGEHSEPLDKPVNVHLRFQEFEYDLNLKSRITVVRPYTHPYRAFDFVKLIEYARGFTKTLDDIDLACSLDVIAYNFSGSNETTKMYCNSKNGKSVVMVWDVRQFFFDESMVDLVNKSDNLFVFFVTEPIPGLNYSDSDIVELHEISKNKFDLQYVGLENFAKEFKGFHFIR